MTERELIYVKTIADEGSISKAAQKLYLSQPSLSHCVQRIEESLGAKLFTRSPTGLTLTYVGERYYSVATEILHIYSDFQQEVGEMKSLRSGRITVGMATYLASRHLDFAVMHSFANSTQQEKSSIAFYPISRSPFVLAAPVGSGLDRYACPDPESPYPVLDLAHVKDWPFVLVSPGRRIRQISDHILWQAGITPQVVLTTVSYETAHRLACRGLGLTFIPLQYKEIFQGPYPGEYYSIDAACSPYWDLCVAVARDSYISNAAQVFIHLLNDYFGNRMEWPGQ